MDNNLLDPQLKSSSTIEIITLGQFSVRNGDKILSEEANKSKKLWELFKYFITHREKRSLPETIQETLWPESDLEYSERAFRTLVYRLRQLLKKALPMEADINPIEFAHGCYYWNTKIKYWLDLEEIEENYTAARKNQETHPELAIAHYRLIVDLYKGSFLQESLYTEWTIPTRNYYRRLYLHAMKEFINILKTQERFSEVIEVCQKVIFLEPLEEDFYIYLIGSLIRQGKVLEARASYNHITSLLYNELGVKPCAEMRKLYTLIKSDGESTDSSEESLTFLPTQGPLFCDKKTFKSICDLEERKSERTENPVLIVSLLLNFFEEQHEQIKLEIALNHLKGILDTNLRRGDVYTLWSENKIALILHNINIKFANKLMARIEQSFKESYKNNSLLLQIQYETIHKVQNPSRV